MRVVTVQHHIDWVRHLRSFVVETENPTTSLSSQGNSVSILSRALKSRPLFPMANLLLSQLGWEEILYYVHFVFRHGRLSPKVHSNQSSVIKLVCLILTHWHRVTHICVSKITIICWDKGLSPGRRQVNIWTNAGILLIGPLETKFSEILIELCSFSLKKMHLKIPSGKWRPFCLGLNVLSNG